MAASSMCRDESDQFMQWLEGRLLQLNADLDASVFVMYICGILESYSGYDDKKESLLDIVGEIAEEDKEAVCDELIQKWDEMSNTNSKQDEAAKTMDEKLSQMLCNTHVTTTNNSEKKNKPLSEEEKARKAAILAQYSNICDEADLDVEVVEEIVDAGGAAPPTATLIAAAAATTTPTTTTTVPASGGPSLMQNTNKDNVTKREKEMRDKMKLDNEKKKDKDKHDRESQKNKKQERKDMEKKRTQKGERRR